MSAVYRQHARESCVDSLTMNAGEELIAVAAASRRCVVMGNVFVSPHATRPNVEMMVAEEIVVVVAWAKDA